MQFQSNLKMYSLFAATKFVSQKYQLFISSHLIHTRYRAIKWNNILMILCVSSWKALSRSSKHCDCICSQFTWKQLMMMNLLPNAIRKNSISLWSVWAVRECCDWFVLWWQMSYRYAPDYNWKLEIRDINTWCPLDWNGKCFLKTRDLICNRLDFIIVALTEKFRLMYVIHNNEFIDLQMK